MVAACEAIDADVLVLQECWSPESGPGTATTVGAALGYTCVEHVLATGRLAGPDPAAGDHWMQPFDWRSGAHAICLDSHRRPSRRVEERFAGAAPGGWGIAVLSRLPVASHRVIELGHLPRDLTARAALVVDVGFTVVGTHMSHLAYGSPVHYNRLRRRLAAELGPGPAVLAGDMNLWGPPLGLLLPGWHRAVKAKTWPAWRPHSQLDHILTRGPVAVGGGEVLPMAGSDHRAVRARLDLV